MADNPRVFFDLSIKGGVPKRVIFELFKHVVPITTENFRALCTGEKGFSTRSPDKPLSYKGSIVHRIVPGFMIQGGDFIQNNGKSGESIYGGEFDDENFEVNCDREGLLVMANKGPNTNQSQWFITLAPAEHLNGKHVVFGRVQTGFNVVHEISQLETDPKKHRPLDVVQIDHCGQLERRQKPKVTQEEPINKSSQNRSDPPHDRKRQTHSPSSSSFASQRSSSSSISSEPSGVARKRRRQEKKEKRKARKSHKLKKLKLKSQKEPSEAEQKRAQEEIALKQIELAQLEAERQQRLDQEAMRIENEKRRKARALELLKDKNNRTAKGGVIYKGRGAMHYRDTDVTFGRTRAWKD